MAATCPRCGAQIPVMKLQGEFSCLSCGAKLGAKVVLPFLAFFVLWSVADLILMVALGAMFQEGGGWALAVRITLSLAAGNVLYWAVFSSVKVETKGEAEKHAS